MSNATREKSLVNHFDEQPYRIKKYLEYLLNEEEISSLQEERVGKHSLADFEEVFDWDKVYVVETDHHVCCNPITIKTKCSSKEEAQKYLDGMKLVDTNTYDWDFYDPDYEVECEHDQKLVFEVENLRVKPQQPKQKTWKLFFEVLADSDLEDTDLDSFCGQVALLAHHQGRTMKVVATDLAQGDSLTPSWAEVVGQK